MKFIILSVVLFCAGCAMPEKTKNYEPALSLPSKAIVYVYRKPTTIDGVNPDMPRFYLKDQELGKLPIGGYYVSVVDPGEVVAYYKDSLFGIYMPWKLQEIRFTAIAGQRYFLRYETAFNLREGKTIKFLAVPEKLGEAEIISTQLLVN